MTSAPTRLVATVHQGGAQGRVQYHDLSNNNTGVGGLERQDSYNTQTQHQVNIRTSADELITDELMHLPMNLSLMKVWCPDDKMNL